MTSRFVFASLVFLLCAHCGSSSAPGSSSSGGPAGVEGASGSCESASDCSGGSTCIAERGGSGACVPTCSVDANDCSGTASCSQVATLTVNVCKKTPSGDGSSESTKEKEPEELYVPCRSDQDCQRLDPTSICATDASGTRECTVPCTSESECAVPAALGVAVDFYNCEADRGNASRKACLFDAKCDANPLSCTSGIPGGTGEGDPGYPGNLGDPGDS